MEFVKRAISSLCVIIYFSFLLIILGIRTSNFIKYFFIFLGAILMLSVYFFVIKVLHSKTRIKKDIDEKSKVVITKRINRIKRFISFFVYSFMIICFLVCILNNGEFHLKYIYPFFQKRFSDNELFNWIIIVSPLIYIVSIYNIYDALLKYFIDKYDLFDMKMN